MLQRKSRIHHLCCQKYFRRLYSYRNAVRLNCHFCVMEATFRKQTYVFSKLWLCSSKGGRKDVSSVGRRNPFALEGYHWVMLSVLSLFILFPVVFSVAFWSSFAYARTIIIIISRLMSFLQPRRSCANSDNLPGPIMLSVSPKRCWMYLRNVLYYYFFFYLYLPLKAIRFFCCRIIQKLRGRRKLTFQTTAFR